MSVEVKHSSKGSEGLAKYSPTVDHIALAVEDIEASIKWYTTVVGLSLVERRALEGKTGHMMTAMLRAGDLAIVLLQGTNPESQISRFVENYGPGLHHVAIQVPEIEPVVTELKASGLEFDTPIVGETTLRQAFARRHDGSRVKLEFIERHVEGFESTNMANLLQTTENKGRF